MILSESLCQNSPRSLSLPSVILSLLDRGLAAPASLVVLVSTIAANSHGANLEGLAVGSKLLWYLQFAHWVVTSLLKSFSSGHLSKWPDSKSYFFKEHLKIHLKLPLRSHIGYYFMVFLMVKLLKLPYSRYTKIISPNFPESPRAHRGSNRPGAEPQQGIPHGRWRNEALNRASVGSWRSTYDMQRYLYIYIHSKCDQSSNQAIKSNQIKPINHSINQSINQSNQSIYIYIYTRIYNYIWLYIYIYDIIWLYMSIFTLLRVGWPPTPQVYFGPWEGLRVVWNFHFP